MITCEWWGCNSDAWYVLIHGCFQQHITESVICLEHFKKWVQAFKTRDLDCYKCGDSIEEYCTLYISVTGQLGMVGGTAVSWE